MLTAALWQVATSSEILTFHHDLAKDKEMIPGQTLLVVTLLLTAVLVVANTTTGQSQRKVRNPSSKGETK